jgi:hypothetical protein
MDAAAIDPPALTHTESRQIVFGILLRANWMLEP